MADYELPDVELWPENQAAFDLFMAMRTQWRYGFNGPTGLDYMPLFRLLDDEGLTGAERKQMLSDIAVMEHAALLAMQG